MKATGRSDCLGTMTGLSRVLLAAWVATLGGITTLSAKQPPPFGDSIEWDTGRSEPSLEVLHGKSVVVVFFQSWCGICNGWSGEFFRQVEEAYAGEPAVVLVALKTDGGDVDDAKDYLESRTDTDHWLVGVDEDATYYRQASGDDKLYYYMWVGPDGTVGRVNEAGLYYGDDSSKEFVLASGKVKGEILDGAEPLMGREPFSEPLQPAVRLAERGLFLPALAEAGRLDADPALKDEVARLRGGISTKLESSVERHNAVLADPSNENRYLSYLALCRIEEDYGSSKPGRAAAGAAMAHARSEWVGIEEEARKDYESIMRRAARADDARSRERVAKALGKLAEEFPATTYGRMAAMMRASMSKG